MANWSDAGPPVNLFLRGIQGDGLGLLKGTHLLMIPYIPYHRYESVRFGLEGPFCVLIE